MDTKETTLITAILITGVIMGIVVVYFVVSIIRQQQRNIQLTRMNILDEIAAMEKERSRLAGDLHDDLGPTLSTIKFYIDSLETSHEKDKTKINKASGYLDDLIARIREISYNLMPSSIQRKGFIPSVEIFIRQVEMNHGLVINFSHTVLPLLGEEQVINLFRIIQESIQNALKHSTATILELKLEWKDPVLKLLCVDNGIGFDEEK